LIIGVVISKNVLLKGGGRVTNLNTSSSKNVDMTRKFIQEISLNSLTSDYFSAYEDSFIDVNADTITYYQKDGEKESSTAIAMSEPIVSVCDQYIAIASRGGKDVAIFRDKQMIYKMTADQNITNIVINKNGDFVLVTEDEYYKNRLSLRDNKGEELFAWLSADGYITSADLSANGKNIAVGTLNAKNNYYSEFFSFNIYDKKPVFNKKFTGQMLIGTTILDNGNFLALFDNEFEVLNSSGNEQRSYTYPADYTMKSFDFAKDGHLALLFSANENSHILTTNVTGFQTNPADLSVTGEVTAFCLCNNSILAATSDKIYDVGWNGSINKTITLGEYNIDRLISLSGQNMLAV